MVEALLDDEAGADAMSTTAVGFDALMYAAILGRADNIEAWLRYFPAWNLERVGAVGNSAFGLALMLGARKLETVEVLLSAGADPTHINYAGATALMLAASNIDTDAPLVRRLLKIPEVAKSIDAKNYPRTLKWRLIKSASKVAAALGSNNAAVLAISNTHNSTALHYIVEACSVTVMRVVVGEGGANKASRNARGQTALDFAYEIYGGEDATPVEVVSALR